MAQPYGYLHVVQALHGDAFMLEYDEGQSSGFMLIDGGPGKFYQRGNTTTTANLFALLNYLSDRTDKRRLESINTVVVTHDDEDHMNGIADLFRFLLRDNNSPNVNWKKGRNLMNSTTLPIKNIWYNSQANLIEQYTHDKKPTKSLAQESGWFDTLLERYNDHFKANIKIKPISFNGEFKPLKKTDPVTLLSAKSLPKAGNFVRKGQFQFNILGPSYDKDLMNCKLIKQLISTSEREGKRLADKSIQPTRSGGSGIWSVANYIRSDYSEKNRSSIAFNAIDYKSTDAKGGLLDTRVLMLGDAVITSGLNTKKKYDIMKIAHHGSSHNNYLTSQKYTMNTTTIRVSEGILKQSFAFFYQVQAKKYVISASGTEGSPNPHITTILGIYFAAVERRIKDRTTPIVDVYLTNKLPRNTLKGIEQFLLEPDKVEYSDGKGGKQRVLKSGCCPDTIKCLRNLGSHMRVWSLKQNTPHGSIPIYDSVAPSDSPSDSPSDPPTNPSMTDSWEPCTFTNARVVAGPTATSTVKRRGYVTGPIPQKRRK